MATIILAKFMVRVGKRFLGPAFGGGFTLVFASFSCFDHLGAIFPNFACFRTFGRSVFAPPSEEIAKR